MRAAIGLSLVSLVSLLAGCAGGSNAAPVAAKPSVTVCMHQLGPRSAPLSAVEHTPGVAALPSRLIVDAKLPLARLTSELESSIAHRLAEGRGARLGPLGVLEYSIDRGAFSLSIVNGSLVIEAPLTGRAEVCSGGRCHARCEPRALARAEISLWLRPDYSFERSRVSLEFTRGCKVRALGGMLSFDATPLLESAVAEQLERTRRQIDSRLPDVHAEIERAWPQLSAPRQLPLGGCLVVDPVGLVQGPIRQSGGMVHARFALLARPELQSDCSGAPEASLRVPPLAADPALPEEDVVALGMQVTLESLARGFESAAPEAGPGLRFRVDEATIQAGAERVSAELTLSGELCGSVALHATPIFDGEAGAITLAAGAFDVAESERVRAAGVNPATLAEELTRLPRAAAPFSLPVLRAASSAVPSLFSDAELSLSARVSELRAGGATARDQSLMAWVEARGSLLLEQR